MGLLKSVKRGQVTIFIIIAIVLVLVVVIIYLNRSNIPVIGTSSVSPVQDIKECVSGKAEEKGSLENIVIRIENQGGVVDPSKNSFMYKGENISYLCYSTGYYEKCVMQKPLLKESIENEIDSGIKNQVKTCLELEQASLEKKGYTVSHNQPNITTTLMPGNIQLSIDLLLKVKKDKTDTYQTIKIDKSSILYEFTIIAGSIANTDAQYGGSETLNYMFYYPYLKVEKQKQSEGTSIYILTNKDTKEGFNFATRSYAIPSGITGK